MKKISALIILFALSALSYGSPKNYQIKSGEIKYEITTEMFGTKNIIDSTLYFDDYGKKEASRTISSGTILGMDSTMDITTITTEEKIYVINNADKEYSIIGVENAEDYSSDISEDFDLEDYEKSGQEKVLGKNCDILIYEGEDEDGKISNKMWMWKGLILRMEITMEMEGLIVSTKMDAKEIKTGNIDKSVFNVPSGYTEINSEF